MIRESQKKLETLGKRFTLFAYRWREKAQKGLKNQLPGRVTITNYSSDTKKFIISFIKRHVSKTVVTLRVRERAFRAPISGLFFTCFASCLFFIREKFLRRYRFAPLLQTQFFFFFNQPDAGPIKQTNNFTFTRGFLTVRIPTAQISRNSRNLFSKLRVVGLLAHLTRCINDSLASNTTERKNLSLFFFFPRALHI